MNWSAQHIPDQKGRVVIITGGNTGLGYQMCLDLAVKNAHVVIACRSIDKGEKAIQKIQQTLHKKVSLEVIPIDLTDIVSIQTFAETFLKKHDRLDILINNAGVVNLKNKTLTKNGLEMHMATNHLGHFALTGLLYKTIINTPNARVVTMSSGGHKWGNIDFEDINWDRRPYDRVKSYGDSKLANLLFMRGLQQRFHRDKSSAISLGAHPGLSATERQQTIGIGGWLTKVLAQPVWKGALPALRAAIDYNANAVEYYGPKYGMRGYPELAKLDKKVYDTSVAERLWTISEKITGVKY